MNRDIAFEGALGALVCMLFIAMTVVEIPFYPQDIAVQEVALAGLAGSILLLLFGFLYGRGKSTPPENPVKT